MHLSDKLILTDADGVLLDWMYAFNNWMMFHGYKIVDVKAYNIYKKYGITYTLAKSLVKTFNESARIEFLPAFRDSIKYIRKLHEEHGYVFHCITSLGSDPYATALRVKNIENLFGKTAFEKITCIDINDSKEIALSNYKDSGCYWLEDKPKNALLGYDLGLSSILMCHQHNQAFEHNDIPTINNWKEFYQLIT